MKTKIVLLFLACSLCISCAERETGSFFCHSYVSVYVIPEEIILYEDDDLLRIEVKGETIVDGEDGFGIMICHMADGWLTALAGPCSAQSLQ